MNFFKTIFDTFRLMLSFSTKILYEGCLSSLSYNIIKHKYDKIAMLH